MPCDNSRAQQEEERLLSWQRLTQQKAMGSLFAIAFLSSFSPL